MKILLVGGNGFLGTALSSLLRANEIECYTLSRSSEKSDFNIDIGNYDDFKKLPDNFFDVIVNCATVLPGGNYLDSNYLEKIFRTNILGTQNICNWLSGQHSVKKIINCSTLVVIAKPWPLNLSENEATYPAGNHVLYCSSKLTQELIFKTFANAQKVTLSQIRFSALYGATMNWNGLICNLINQSKKNKKIILTNGNKVSADFLHVNDASRIILATIKNEVSGIINGASGTETTVLKLAEIIKEHSPENIKIENVETDNFKEDRSVVNIDKLKKIVDVNSFVTLPDGINEMMKL